MKGRDLSTSGEGRVAPSRSPVGFSSGGHDASRSPSASINLGCYNWWMNDHDDFTYVLIDAHA